LNCEIFGKAGREEGLKYGIYRNKTFSLNDAQNGQLKKGEFIPAASNKAVSLFREKIHGIEMCGEFVTK